MKTNDSKPAVTTEVNTAETPANVSATETSTEKTKSEKAPAKKAAIKKVPVKKIPAKKNVAAPAKKIPAKKTPAKVAVKKAVVKTPAKKTVVVARTADNFNRDFSRYKVNGDVLSKGRAVLAMILDYVAKKKPTLAQLKQAFPDTLLKNYGVIADLSKARKYNVNGKSRYFMNKADVIVTKDGKSVVVSNQWSTENIKPIVKHAKTLGFIMTPAK